MLCTQQTAIAEKRFVWWWGVHFNIVGFRLSRIIVTLKKPPCTFTDTKGTRPRKLLLKVQVQIIEVIR